MELVSFCRELPKVELHAHLNGSLSPSTMLQLKRCLADSGLVDKTDVFVEAFQIGAGDSRNLSDCFQVFGIAHTLTSTPECLSLATLLTLQEFQEDGCCYLELRSTPRETPHMTRSQYIETIVKAIQKASNELSIIARLIVSIDRRLPASVVSEITDMAIEFHKRYPEVVVGLELSGNPLVARFIDFVPNLQRARDNGLKIALHCGEVCNPKEIIEMLQFRPERIGHGACIHPRLGGTEQTWATLCDTKIPVEICLTSNVNTKLTLNYESHHFKELFNANLPLVICTDDKGVFCTSLSQEYRICADTFSLDRSQLANLSLSACQFVFAEEVREEIRDKILHFIQGNNL